MNNEDADISNGSSGIVGIQDLEADHSRGGRDEDRGNTTNSEISANYEGLSGVLSGSEPSKKDLRSNGDMLMASTTTAENSRVGINEPNVNSQAF